jgi:hypothetical protein
VNQPSHAPTPPQPKGGHRQPEPAQQPPAGPTGALPPPVGPQPFGPPMYGPPLAYGRAPHEPQQQFGPRPLGPPPYGPPQPPRPGDQPSQRKPAKRRVLLITLGALVGAAIVGGVLRAGTSAPAPQPAREPASGQVTTAASVQAYQLQPGDCYNDTNAPPTPGETTSVGSVQVVPCTSPHNYQIFAKINYKVWDQFADIEARKGRDCTTELVKLDRKVRNDPNYQPGYLMPSTVKAWETHRVVACYMYTPAPTTTSVTK